MFYHCFHSPGIHAPHYIAWWAVHAESLTPIRVTALPGLPPRVSIKPVMPPAGEPVFFSSHNAPSFDLKEIGRDLFREIHQHINGNSILSHIRPIPRETAKVPEYLIVYAVNGEHPAIFHSTDPHSITPCDPADESILIHTGPLYYKIATDLSVEGFAYWWEDSQRALERLAPDFAAAAKALPF